MKGLKIHIILLAGVITLALALAGQRLFYQHRVADPLRGRIEQLPGVASATIETTNDGQIVVIGLDKDADLRSTYTATRALALESLGEAFRGIRVRDSRDDALIESFYRMHFYVQQAVATGLFADMAEGVDAIARQDLLDSHRVFVDDDRVYVQLRRGDHHLYEVIARPTAVADAHTERQALRAW